jgi:hypothetical protein
MQVNIQDWRYARDSPQIAQMDTDEYIHKEPIEDIIVAAHGPCSTNSGWTERESI